jgi:hypothetical protein
MTSSESSTPRSETMIDLVAAAYEWFHPGSAAGMGILADDRRSVLLHKYDGHLYAVVKNDEGSGLMYWRRYWR